MIRVAAVLALLALLSTLPADVHGGSAASLMGAGYYVAYDDNSRSTVQSYGQQLNWVITTNFEIVNSQGAIRGTHDQAIVDQARAKGAAVHVRVHNREFSRPIAHAVLTRRNSRRRVEEEIVRLLTTYGYDGVNIDLENIPPSDRQALSAFVAGLSGRLRAMGKTVTIAVPPKAVDDPSNDWNGAFDYAALGAAVDWFVFMAYDLHGPWSDPGPIASIGWVQEVAAFAAGKVTPNKLLMGIALYGADWAVSGTDESISMRQAVDRAAANGASILWDEAAKVPYYTYPGHIVYFENPQSVSYKLALASTLQLSGVAFWRLGHEVPAAWDVIAPYMQRSGLASARRSEGR